MSEHKVFPSATMARGAEEQEEEEEANGKRTTERYAI
jgi:hypothetical protein